MTLQDSLNAQLAAACARVAACRFDGNAIFRLQWTLGDLSRLDWVSPSVQGQRKPATTTWKATFPFEESQGP